MTGTSLRILAAVALAVTLLVGVYLSGKARRDAETRVADFQAGIEHSEAKESETTPPPPLEQNPEQFELRLGEDLTRFGLAPLSVQDLGQPNPYFNELEKPVLLAPGKSWSSPHLRIRARLDKVNYIQHGARVSSNHVIARAENISKGPIAYRLKMRGEAGKCEVRGAREHNAITLRPRESAEIVVCAGRDRIRLESLEVLEVTDLGHHYLSQLTPLALGSDSTTAAAHKPVVNVNACTDIDSKTLAAYLQAGTAQWADVVDFYSRHSCHRLEFFPGYRRVETALPALPVVAPH